MANVSATICGIDRRDWQWVLRVQALVDRDIPAILSGMSKDQATALESISDHTKLAMLIAELLRGHGRTVHFYDQDEHEQLGLKRGDMVWVDERFDPTMIKVCLEVEAPPFDASRSLCIQDARTFALQLLNSPQDVIATIERETREAYEAYLKESPT